MPIITLHWEGESKLVLGTVYYGQLPSTVFSSVLEQHHEVLFGLEQVKKYPCFEKTKFRRATAFLIF